MKKFIVILIGALLGFQSINAQTETKNDPTLLKDPIMPRKTGNDEYRLTYVRDTFLLGSDPLNVWWRDNMLKTINEAYAALGKSRRVDVGNINWIRDRMSYSYKDLGPYMNSGLQGQNGVFFEDKDGWSGNCGVFRDEEEDVVVILFKTQCMNLVRVPQQFIPKVPPIAYNPPSRSDTIRTNGITIINQIYNNNSITGSGNSTNTNTAGSTPNSGSVDYIRREEPLYREQVISPTRGIYQTSQRQVYGSLDITIGGGRYQQVEQQDRKPNDGRGNPIIRTKRKPNDGDGHP